MSDEGEHLDEEQTAKVSAETELQALLAAESFHVWEDVLKTYAGRQAMWEILVEAKIHATSFTGDRWGDFNEGRRDLGNWLIANKIFTTGQEWYTLMGSEAQQRDERVKQLREQRGL